jgi:hypothetical protein
MSHGKAVTRKRNVCQFPMFGIVQYVKVNFRNSLVKKINASYFLSESHTS